MNISLIKQKNNIFSIVLPSIFLMIAIGNFLWHAYGYRQDIFAKFDPTYWEYRYNHSQWSSVIKCLVTDPHINPHTCVWDDNWYQAHKTVLPEYKKISIGDDGLYAYVGYIYIHGKDPSLVNAELPPFGKYMVGMFELITGKMGTFSLFFTGLSLVLLFFFTVSVFKSPLLASLTTLIFSYDPILIEQIRAPYLDTLYLCLFILTSWAFIKEKYIVSGIFLGLFMSVKPPFFAVIVLIVYALCLVIQKKQIIKPLCLLIASSAITYVATYIRMFVLGDSFINFFQVQKYIIHFYSTGAKGVIGAVIFMLLEGKWPTWFGPIQSVTEWTILWPMSLIISIVGFIFVSKLKNRSTGIVFHALWIVGYLAFLIITPLFPRYLLLLLPFMYNLSIWAFLKSISLKYSWGLPS